MNVIIERPHQIVHHGLHIQFAKTGENFDAHISFAIAIRVLQIPDVRRSGDEYAALPAGCAGRPRQPFGKHGALIKHPIAIRVFEQANATNWLIRRVFLTGLVMRFVGVGVVAHLADIGTAIFVIRHRHGTRDHGFCSEQIHAEAVEHAEGLRRIFGCGGWNRRQLAGDRVFGRRGHDGFFLGMHQANGKNGSKQSKPG